MESSVFMSSRSQAVRIPKSIALPAGIKRVEVLAIGRARIITPVGETWDSWFDGPGVSDDCLLDREQPATQERESF